MREFLRAYLTMKSESVSCSVVSHTKQSHELQQARLPCPSLFSGACSNSCPLSQWCYPAISSSVILFSSCPQSFPESGSFPVSWFFVSGGQSIGALASASVLLMNIQGWFPLRLTGLISLLSKELSQIPLKKQKGNKSDFFKPLFLECFMVINYFYVNLSTSKINNIM